MIDLLYYIKDAMKRHDTVALLAYRNLKNEIQKYETSKGAKPVDDGKQLEIFNKYAKTLEDSIRQFSEAGRDDLVAQYTSELEVVKKLLPDPVTAQQLIDFVQSDEYFDKYYVGEEFESDGTVYTRMIQAIPKKEMGACIKYIKSKFPTANGADISNLVKALVI